MKKIKNKNLLSRWNDFKEGYKKREKNKNNECDDGQKLTRAFFFSPSKREKALATTTTAVKKGISNIYTSRHEIVKGKRKKK